MRKKAILALALAAHAGRAGAVGFNDVLPGARAMGMGGAFTAVADDAQAPWYNPAGTANVPYLQGAGSLGRYQSPVGTLSFLSLAYLRPYPLVNTATVGAAYYHGQQGGPLGGDKDVFLFNYAQELPVRGLPLTRPLKVGGNFKFINVKKGDAKGQFGAGFDGGVLARTNFGLAGGLALTDLTSGVGVPRAGLNLGVSYLWQRRLLFVGDLRVRGGHAEFYPGLEAIFHQGLLRARFGKGLPLDGINTLAAGVGVNFSPVVLDAAISLPSGGFHRPGGGFQATLSYRFGAPSFAGQFVGQAAAQAETLRAEIASLEDRKKTLEQQTRTSETNRTASEGELRVLEKRVAEAQDQYRALIKRNEELDYRSAEKAASLRAGPKPSQLPMPKPPAWPKKHPVKSGETLRTLAGKYYGDPNLWERIYDANRDKVERGLPLEGAVLTIPSPKP